MQVFRFWRESFCAERRRDRTGAVLVVHSDRDAAAQHQLSGDSVEPVSAAAERGPLHVQRGRREPHALRERADQPAAGAHVPEPAGSARPAVPRGLLRARPRRAGRAPRQRGHRLGAQLDGRPVLQRAAGARRARGAHAMQQSKAGRRRHVQLPDRQREAQQLPAALHSLRDECVLCPVSTALSSGGLHNRNSRVSRDNASYE